MKMLCLLGGGSPARRYPSLVLCAALLSAACQKDEPPPPLPEPKAATEEKEQPLELKPEDAGPLAKPEKPKATGKRVKRAPTASLKKCCDALRQNAASAPEPTKQYMLSAAGMCDAMAAQGKDLNTVAGMISGALKGAGLPAQCH